MTKKRFLVPVLVALGGLAALGSAAYITFGARPSANTAVAIGGPFELTAHDGRTFSDRDVSGTPFLVFFGFTHCPEICPTALFEISEALRATGDRGSKLRALFITVDPERDTPEVMKSYLSSFDERIVGLSGSPETIKAVTRAYRAYAARVPLKDGGYTMDHTSSVYLMDRNGRFLRTLDIKRPPEAVARDLLALS